MSSSAMAKPLLVTKARTGLSVLETNVLLDLDEYMSIVSLLLCLFTLYWLLRIKRNFRQDLILCLVINDILKSLAFLILPLVHFSGVAIDSSAPYCQFSGWLMALAMEGTVIALQTMLYVINPPQKAGQGGVYKYRALVYALWVVIPVLLASLPFVNPKNPFVSLGSFCYMPATPIWYRLVLAWIPRSISFLTILSSYAAINVYVHYKFKGFKTVGSNSSTRQKAANNSVDKSLASAASALDNSSTPAIPSVHSRKSSGEDFITTARIASSEDWESMDFITSPLPIMQTNQATEYPFSILSDQNSLGPARPVLQRSQASSAALLKPAFPFQNRRAVEASDSRAPQSNSIDAKRMAIQRQLKNLFIYPIAYIVMWIFPFATVIWQAIHAEAAHPPYWLMIAYTISLAGQATINPCVILWRERPWNREKAQLPEWAEKIAQWKRRVFSSRRVSVVLPKAGQTSHDSSMRSADAHHWWEKDTE